MDVFVLFQKFGLALGLGLLVGLQRERSASSIAGFRTFPLVTALGTLAAVAVPGQGWVLPAAGLIAVAMLCVIANAMKMRAESLDPGLTTEAALLLMYCLGVFIATGPAEVAVVIGAVVAVLLHLKPVLHGFATRLGEQDFRGIMQFVAVALVILPIVPDMQLGPYGVLNPRKIWLLVVLITGISLAGYLLYRFFSERSSTLLAGVLGGLISSTATTVSFARKTKEAEGVEPSAALVILLSGSVVFARVLVLIAITAPAFFPQMAPPLAAMLGLMMLLSGVLWWRSGKESASMPEQKNPTELKAALFFTALFAVVLVAIAFAKDRLGDSGLYVVAVLSGLTDMDAITLSLAQMAADAKVVAGMAWRLILIGALSNIVFKTGTVAALGSRRLLARVGAAFGVAVAGGVAILVFWP